MQRENKIQMKCQQYTNTSVFSFCSSDRESIFEIILYKNKLQQVNVRAKRGAKPLTSKEMKTAEAFIQKYYPNIVEKWVNYFVKKQNVRKTTIKTKL